MIRRLLWVLLFLTAPIEAAEFVLGAPEDKAQATVGCLFPMNGRAGLYGRDSLIGIQLAFEYLQKQQEKYPPIRVLVADNRSKVSKTIRQVRDFIHDNKVRFICGIVNSSIALQVVRVTEKEKVFFIGTDHASSQLTREGLFSYYFRMNNNSQQSMKAAAHYIKEKFKTHTTSQPLRLAYIGPDYDYGYQIWKDLRQDLDRMQVNYQVEAVFWPELYESDYSPYLRVLLEKEVDLVINALWGGDLVAFIQQANQTTLFQKMRFANFDTGGNYEVLAALGKEMPAGLILSSRHHNNWPDTAYNRWFVERFFATSGRYPSYAAEGAYSGILAIAESLRIAGPNASDDDVREVLRTLKLKLPEDPDNFSSFINPKNHQLQQVIAIGETVPNSNFSPAQMMLGNWKIYWPQQAH